MDLIDRIKSLAASIPKQVEHIQTEEATKHALVMPFIQALGYNIFDPTEVTPELVADIGTKKGEKVDYAILFDMKPMILFECKWCGADLAKEHASQLFRYFSVTSAKFGVLTNGISYRFYTDLDEPNKMDSKPFFEFNMLDFTDAQVDELKRFSKSSFALDQVVMAAADLKYTREVKRVMAEQLASPSEEFVRLFASQIYGGKLTQAVRSQFTDIVRRALQQFVSERVSDRLKSALEQETGSPQEPAIQSDADGGKEPPITTTEEEKEAFYIIKSILRSVLDPRRVFMRDAQSYCAILLDDNNRKTLCRLYFGARKKAIGLFDAAKQEERLEIQELNDIYGHAERLIAAASSHVAPSTEPVNPQQG